MRADSLLLLALLTGCIAPEQTRSWNTAALTPMPPGARAFCTLHGSNCDTIPVASAMPEGGSASPPQGWRDFCGRHPATAGCSR